MKVAELANSLKEELMSLESQVDNQDLMQIALNLKKGSETITRYLKGDVKMKNLELAEKILEETKKVLSEKLVIND